MYCPAHFNEERPEMLLRLIEQHPLATIVVNTPAGLVAEHVPLMHVAAAGTAGALIGHVARANPLWTCSPEQELLVVFQGPSAYISPGWYATKAETGKVMPTWNYAVVHAHCRLQAHEDPQRIRQILDALTQRHETSRSRPWQVSDAPADYVDRLIEAVVGIELRITRMHGKWKLSQNQPARNRETVIQGLTAQGTAQAVAMAALVQAAAES